MPRNLAPQRNSLSTKIFSKQFNPGYNFPGQLPLIYSPFVKLRQKSIEICIEIMANSPNLKLLLNIFDGNFTLYGKFNRWKKKPAENFTPPSSKNLCFLHNSK